MNRDTAEGNWRQFKGEVKARWGNLTDDHLDVIAGKRVEWAGKLQESDGPTTDKAESRIKGFEEANKDSRPNRPSWTPSLQCGAIRRPQQQGRGVSRLPEKDCIHDEL